MLRLCIENDNIIPELDQKEICFSLSLHHNIFTGLVLRPPFDDKSSDRPFL